MFEFIFCDFFSGQNAIEDLSKSGIKKENIECVQLDVRDLDSISKSVEFVKEKYGKIDILVNNAGIAFKKKDGFNYKS